MQPTWDLIVIGAGVLGTAHAYYAAKRGWRVLLLERGDWPGEASVRNFGTLMPGSLTGEWRRRGMESIAVYRELAPQAGFDFFPCGSLYHVTTPVEADVLTGFARLAPAERCRCELLEPGRAAALILPLLLFARSHVLTPGSVLPIALFGLLYEAIAVAFGLAISVASAWLALTIHDAETAERVMYFPSIMLSFVSSAFAPVAFLVGWMQPIARVNPVTAAADLIRSVAAGGPAATPALLLAALTSLF